jgi:ATP-dependent protease ClpP protease subunit
MKIILSALVLCFGLIANAKTIQLNTTNTVNFRGPVEWDSVTKVKMELYKKLKERGKKHYPIYIVLDSPGGSIAAGEAFIEFAKMYSNVHTISIFSASMASAIVEALPGKRYVLSTGVFMFHRARGLL